MCILLQQSQLQISGGGYSLYSPVIYPEVNKSRKQDHIKVGRNLRLSVVGSLQPSIIYGAYGQWMLSYVPICTEIYRS